MPVDETRLNNLRLLIADAGGNQTVVANRIGTNPAYLSQILNRTPLPSGSTRGMGSRLARQIEQAFDKPEGWMDRDQKQSSAERMGSTPGRIADNRAPYGSQSATMKKIQGMLHQMTEQELEIAVAVLEGIRKKQH